MMQFYETYRDQPKLSWTHNLLILSCCKREEEREFYPILNLGGTLSEPLPREATGRNTPGAGLHDFLPGRFEARRCRT